MDQRFFAQPFAVNGDRTVVPDPVQSNGSVSFDQGFGFDYERELGVDPDAKPVPRDATNYLFYALTQAVGQYQTAGIPEFITAADNGGAAYAYGRGVMVRYRAAPGDPFVTYVSKTAGNTSVPGATTDWGTWIFEAADNSDTTSTDKIATPAYVTARLAALSFSVPQATTTVSGRTRYATGGEATAGTVTDAAVTPAALAAAATAGNWATPQATTTVSGRTRYATGGEATAGTVTDAAVTPAALAAAATAGNWATPQATTTVSGRTRYATGGEATAGTVTDAAVTPAALAAAVPQATTGTAGRTRYATAGETTAQAVVDAAVTPAGLTGYAKLSTNVTFGNVTATGYDTASSARIKDVFPEPFPYGLREVLRIRPVVGAYRRDYSHPPGGLSENRARLFLIAEQAGAYVPEAMTPDGTTYRGEAVPTLDYSQFVPVLIAALQQEHRARVLWQRIGAAALAALAVWQMVG